MAKITLQVFGVLTVLPGILLIAAGFESKDPTVLLLGGHCRQYDRDAASRFSG